MVLGSSSWKAFPLPPSFSRQSPGTFPCVPRMPGPAFGRQPDQQGDPQVPVPADISDIEFASTLDDTGSQASENSAAADSVDGSADQSSSAEMYSELSSMAEIQPGTPGAAPGIFTAAPAGRDQQAEQAPQLQQRRRRRRQRWRQRWQ